MSQPFRKKIDSTARLTLEEAFNRFISAKIAAGLSSKTIKTYQAHFAAISKFKSPKDSFDQVTRASLSDLVAAMARAGLSKNSVRSYTATLKTFLSWARSEELTDADVKLYKGAETVPEIYTDHELELLLRHPDRRCTFAEFRNWVIVCLLVNNGIRASTLRSILIGDVDLQNSVIICRHMKAGVLQNIPLCPTLVKALKEYLPIRSGAPEEPLFCDVEGKEMSEVCLRHAIERYNNSRGVKSSGIHKFRHTFARLYLVECGGDALKLQKLLGHSTLDMTKHYVRIFATDLVKDFQTHSPLEKIKKG